MISFILASFKFLFISFWSENADILFSLLRCSARKLKCIRNSKIRINYTVSEAPVLRQSILSSTPFDVVSFPLVLM